MDFDGAIRAHSEWKSKLAVYLRHPDKSLDPAVVGLDDRCPLGQWIKGEGNQYAKSPTFTTLRTQHTAFHRAAADIIRRADTGKDVSADVALGSESAFGKASMQVVAAIMAMKRESF